MSAAKNTVRIQRMCVAALLCAIAILIPMISPVKIQLGPMSFTLGSHVAIFIAMFISPAVALTVELGATLGFLLAGFPPVVVLRALSQVVFVAIGAFLLGTALLALVLFAPFMEKLFLVQPLDAVQLAVIAVAALVPTLIVQLVKTILCIRHRAQK